MSIAVVTGGAGGIGLGIARALAERGTHLVIADIDGAAAHEAAASLTSAHGVEAEAHEVDVSDPAAVEELAASIDRAVGPVQLLFNNAGVMPVGTLLEHSADDWRWVFDVNVLGVVNGLTAFVPRMLAHGEPCRVVNTASMAAFGPTESLSAYVASKQAVLGLTESLAIELEGTNVAVSVVCPGAVDTEIAQSERNRQQRYGAPSGRCMPIGPEQEKAALQLIHPDEAGRRIVAGVEAGEFWIFTHPEWCRRLPSRFADAHAASLRTIRGV
jgi:NAD(P)-dependent dehydrogenase (short-subunit alcohol dehydrogenase family)